MKNANMVVLFDAQIIITALVDNSTVKRKYTTAPGAVFHFVYCDSIGVQVDNNSGLFIYTEKDGIVTEYSYQGRYLIEHKSRKSILYGAYDEQR